MSTSRRKKSKTAVSFFDELVLNALDFLRASVRDLKHRPKYSVINFCAGLELFFKARLSLEHWSLIATKPEAIKLESFKRGEFHSVSLDDAIQRLQNVAREVLTSEEMACFRQVREHRNRLVHFFHEAYVKTPSKKVTEKIVIEQCQAWFYLYRLLTGRWQNHFNAHQRKLNRLNSLMHRHRVFLSAKCAALSSDIAAELSHDIEYRDCGSCGCMSARIDSPGNPLFESTCRVCDAQDRFLRVACPHCGEENDISDVSSAFCVNEDCEKDITFADILAKYEPAHDPKEEREVYFCGHCEHYEESVILAGDKFLCLWCLTDHDSVDQCGYCGSEIAGFDPEGSGAFGCFMCEHAIPWDRR
jgi:hypothetical protein